MHEELSLAGLQCLFGMSSVGWAHRGQKQQVSSQTSSLSQTCLRSRPSGQDVWPSTRDPRSSIYRHPQPGQALQNTHPDSDWTIKPYISQCAQMERHNVRSPRTCCFTPTYGQLVPSTHPPVLPQPPIAPPVWSIEPSADPWNASWDSEAPGELKQFLLEVLLTPNEASKRSCSSEQHQQNLPLPAPAPELFSKAAGPVDRPNSSRSKGVTATEAEAAAPGSSELASVSLDTVTDRSVDSNAATSTAAFSRAASAQQTGAARARLQTPSSRRRSRAGSEQTDAQTAPDSLHTQPAIGSPSKKIKLAAGRKAAKPVLSPAEIIQAAKDGVIFAKFARFAPWPAQVSVPNEQQQSELGPPSEGQRFVVFFGQGNYQYVSLDKVIPFEDGWSKHKSGKSSLDVAVKEAVAYLKARVSG